MKPEVQEFFEGKRFAIVGVSRTSNKFGNSIYTELKQRGYEVFAVHPELKEINGDPCYPNLEALKSKADGVIICVTPDKAGPALREAADAGFKKIWLQQGAQSPEVLKLAGDLGVTPVAGKCILLYATPVQGLHSIHRGFARLFGQL